MKRNLFFAFAALAVITTIGCSKDDDNDDGTKNAVNDSDTEYVDMGLSSGTKWKSADEKGFFTYQQAVEKYKNNLPTKQQFDELMKNCQWKWENGCFTVTAKNGNSIKFYANGYMDDGELECKDIEGDYWSSTPQGSGDAWYLYFGSDEGETWRDLDYEDVAYGFSVKLVSK